MSYLKAQKDGQELLVPQLLLDGNYISYSPSPASPDSEGKEGQLKTAPDGLYYFADGLWRKVPAYTTNWDDLDESVRFMRVDKTIQLTPEERQILRNSISISTATQSSLGLVKGGIVSDSQGAVTIDSSGSMYVKAATATYAGVVRITETGTTSSSPIVATKAYVDAAISSTGQAIIDVPTTVSRGGIMLGGDVLGCDSLGRISLNRASYTTGQIPSYGIVHIAPPEFTANPGVESYDDSRHDIPYVTTVSQARGIAQDVAGKTPIIRTSYIATTQDLGFVKIAAGAGLSITTDGNLSSTVASTTSRGIVQIYNPDNEIPGTVPYMSQVKDYIQNAGYIKSVTLPVASNTQLGAVKTQASNAIQVSPEGIITARQAAVGQGSGLVTIVNNPPANENNSVLTAYRTKQLIDAKQVTVPDATQQQAGKVLVQLGATDTTLTTQIVPTVNYMNEQQQNIFSSSQFNQAVETVLEAHEPPPVQKKPTWRIYMMGNEINEDYYEQFTGTLVDGTPFSITRDNSTIRTAGGLTSAYATVQVNKACYKDILMPRVLSQVIANAHNQGPVFVTIVD